MVWSFERERSAALESHPHQLGHCILRILFNGASKQIWIFRWYERVSIKDHAGSNNIDCVLCVCSAIPERTISLEISRELLFPLGGSVLYVQEDLSFGFLFEEHFSLHNS